MWLSIINNINILFYPLDLFEILYIYIYWLNVSIPIEILGTIGIRETLETIWTTFFDIVMIILVIIDFLVLMLIKNEFEFTDYDGKFNWRNYLCYHLLFANCIIIVGQYIQNLIIRLQQWYNKFKYDE
jgi:hypothetical protein